MENEIEVNEMEHSSLLDCYRIALDFGMPAALRAYEKLTVVPVLNETETMVNAEEMHG